MELKFLNGLSNNLPTERIDGTFYHTTDEKDVSANISFITESNYPLTDDGTLNTLTLQWHQYQLWCTLYATLNSDGTYTITITKA